MQRWNWFLSADIQGRWIITNGYADVDFNRPSFSASLRYSAETEPYQNVVGVLNDQGVIEATVTSPDKDIPPYFLRGPLFEDSQDQGAPRTVLLTDGTTILGITFGPHSNEDNL